MGNKSFNSKLLPLYYLLDSYFFKFLKDYLLDSYFFKFLKDGKLIFFEPLEIFIWIYFNSLIFVCFWQIHALIKSFLFFLSVLKRGFFLFLLCAW